jgi:plasmid stability protein
MNRITVDLDEELYERLRHAAYTEHRSMADIVRELLAAHLAK